MHNIFISSGSISKPADVISRIPINNSLVSGNTSRLAAPSSSNYNVCPVCNKYVKNPIVTANDANVTRNHAGGSGDWACIQKKSA